jgi:dephospho-CoA kinase
MILLGISGSDGSGKGAVVSYLVSQYGFVHYSARNILIDILMERSMEPTRAHMRIVANEMREKYGDDFIVRCNLEKIQKSGTTRAIIESIRTTAEAETLKKEGGILFAIDADQKLRYERIQARCSETDAVSYEEFVAHETLESHDPNPHGMQKQKVMHMAEYTIFNNGDFSELYEKIEKILTEIGYFA